MKQPRQSQRRAGKVRAEWNLETGKCRQDGDWDYVHCAQLTAAAAGAVSTRSYVPPARARCSSCSLEIMHQHCVPGCFKKVLQEELVLIISECHISLVLLPAFVQRLNALLIGRYPLPAYLFAYLAHRFLGWSQLEFEQLLSHH